MSETTPDGWSRYSTHDAEVPGGRLRFGEWAASAQNGEPEKLPVLAIHGITATHRAWDSVAAALPEVRVLAPDLRGRGRSNEVGGPFGYARHADDMVAVLDAAGVGQAVVVGHSMGAFVTLALAHRHPDRVASVVLLDGGLPVQLPPGVEVESATAAVLGPALARLSMTFDDHAAYQAFWKQHPALGPDWSPAIEEYVNYDLAPGDGGGWRSSVSLDAVAADSPEVFGQADVEAQLATLSVPTPFLRAPRGLLNEEGGLYPPPVIEAWQQRQPMLAVTTVPDVNHYTLIFKPEGVAAVTSVVRTALERT